MVVTNEATDSPDPKPDFSRLSNKCLDQARAPQVKLEIVSLKDNHKMTCSVQKSFAKELSETQVMLICGMCFCVDLGHALHTRSKALAR